MASKHSRWLALVVVSSALAGAIHVTGCGNEDNSIFDGSDGGSGDDGSVTNPPPFTNDGSAQNPYKSFVIDPKDPVITVDLGASSPAIDFTVKGVLPDGSEVPLSGGAFEINRIDVAAFTGAKLVPTGFVGGVGEVKYKWNGAVVATTSATVRLRITAGTPPSQAIQDAFKNATAADAAMSLLYPYDGTVFPRGLPTPVIQWNGGADADIYKIEAKSATFEFLAYQTVPTPSRFPFPSVPANVWAKLTDSTVGNVDVSIQRWDGAQAYKAKTQKWTIAPANLNGTIYYTRLIQGDSFVRRIQPGKVAESFLDGTGVTCIACHSVSKDGSRIVASVNGGASPWATFDTVTGAKLYQSAQASGFQAISPTGSHVLWRHWNGGGFGSEGELRLSTYNNDAVLATLNPGGGAPGHPVWSPDGKHIAFSVRPTAGAGNGLNFDQSTLWTTDVDLTANPPTFSNTKKIVDPNAQYAVVTYPSFTPDSKWIGFMRGNQSRSDGVGAAELWLGSADGQTQIRLDRANGVPDVSATPSTSWGPSFHPIAAGGYFWLAFFTERPYGNTLNTTLRQLWIAAVDGAPKAGQDPSHPAFYITGQDVDSTNERPQFTVNPCKPLGQSCENGYDCCDGYCRATDGGLVCQKKGNECAQQGDKCETSADCCNGLTCIGGFCSVSPPK
jgi:hypothetical protein